MTAAAPYQHTLYLAELPDFPRTSLVRFVLLSVLLHAWLVLMFGDATRPSDRNAGVLWGQINVALKKLAPVEVEAPNLRMSTEIGAAKSAAPPRSRPVPVMPSRDVVRESPPALTPPVDKPEVQEPLKLEATPLAPMVPPRVEPIRALPEPAARVVPPAEVPLAPIAVPTVEARPLQLPEPTSRVAPVLSAPLTPLAPVTSRSVEALPEPVSRVEPPSAQPLQQMAPAQSTALPTLPEPAARVEVEPARPLAPLTPSVPQRLESEVLERASRMDAPAAQPLQPLAPSKVERAINRMPDELPARVEVPPAERLNPLSPMPVERPINRLMDAPADPLGTLAPRPSPGLSQPQGEPRSPGSGARTESLPDLKTTPRLDVNALRQRARELSAGDGGRSALLAGPKLPPKTREQEIFDKSLQEKDCKTAYADMGLLAIAPLVFSALAPERKCKW